MQHFPIFMAVAGRRVVVSGRGEAALAKLRLLAKTQAHVSVFAADPAREVRALADDGRIRLVPRALGPGDALCAVLFYAANDDATEDARVTALAQADGALTNWVDNLERSQFITPAIVDRDPVTIAIGTEGAAPVLARAIKRDLEDRLPTALGVLARIGKGFRRAAGALAAGRPRRDFWTDWYFATGPRAVAAGGAAAAETALPGLLHTHRGRPAQRGHVDLVGAGPGDPELLTLKARRLLHEADVVVHDGLVAPAILELARREARLIAVGKTGFGPHTPQAQIATLMIEHARGNAQVVRLKSGDPGIFGRLDEEIAALDVAGIPWAVTPGITAAAAAAATTGTSLTRRGRNASLHVLTGHDMDGFAEHDWRALARPGTVAAIYMAKRGARFVAGRLLMHGAAPDTPVTVVTDAARPGQATLGTTLSRLPDDLAAAAPSGPAVILYGLAPRHAGNAVAERADASDGGDGGRAPDRTHDHHHEHEHGHEQA